MWRIVFYIAADDKGNLGRIGVSFLGYVRVLAVKKCEWVVRVPILMRGDWNGRGA
jgi:hypothetical protein